MNKLKLTAEEAYIYRSLSKSKNLMTVRRSTRNFVWEFIAWKLYLSERAEAELDTELEEDAKLKIE